MATARKTRCPTSNLFTPCTPRSGYNLQGEERENDIDTSQLASTVWRMRRNSASDSHGAVTAAASASVASTCGASGAASPVCGATPALLPSSEPKPPPSCMSDKPAMPKDFCWRICSSYWLLMLRVLIGEQNKADR